MTPEPQKRNKKTPTACCYLIFALSCLPLAAQPVPSDETIAARIEALVGPQAEAELVSGVILVARGGEILFQREYGFAHWELRVPNSPSNRFGIGSITKPMTEILVGLLADADRLDPNAPVETYLPGFPRGPSGGVPTIQHLLTHRSGVPHRVTDAVDETQPMGPADVVERVLADGLLFEPGSQRLYSSAGFTCLARVVEIVEKKPFESLLAERLFEPAGMSSATSETGQRLMPGRATPHRLGAHDGEVVVANAPYKDLRFLTGAGSVYATAEDLLRFVEAIRALVFGAEVRAETFAEDATSWHGFYGRTSGYESSVDVLPAQDLVFVFLSNLRSAANWQIREQIRNILLGRDPAGIPLPPAVGEPFEAASSIVGLYGNPEAPVEIAVVDGKLFRGDNEFYPIEGGRYYIPASGTVMRFRRNQAGDVDAIISISGGGRESVLPRLMEP